MTISVNYQNIDPSLILDFANSEVLDPRIAFSRPTTATYYDNHTSVLAEQNLLLQSNTFNNAAWVATNGTVASGVTDPAGGTTAYSITATSANATVYQTLTTTATPYTISFWIQRVTGTGTINLTLDGTNFTAVTITGSWAKYQATATPTAASHTIGIQVTTSGDVVNIYGSQLENRSSATATNITTTTALNNYIPVLQTAASNQARFDHDPVTRTSLGLLIEQQSTNLLTYSSDMSNGIWTKQNVTVTTAANIAPDGTQTANLIVPNTTSTFHRVYQSSLGVYTGNITGSIYAKAAGYNYIGLASSVGLQVDAVFNLATGTFVSGSSPNYLVTSVGNGWYRFSAESFVAYTGNAMNFAASVYSTSSTGNYAGDGYSGVYFWGGQLEQLLFSTSYIPTVASQVTRSADAPTISGTNLTNWYNSAQGSYYCEFNSFGYAGALGLLSNQIGNSGSIMYSNAGNNNIASYDGSNFGTYQSSLVNNTFYKIAIAMTTTLNTYCGSGNTPTTTATTGNLLNTTTLNIGNRAGSYLNGHIKKLSYYPTAVTSANLIALTGS